MIAAAVSTVFREERRRSTGGKILTGVPKERRCSLGGKTHTGVSKERRFSVVGKIVEKMTSARRPSKESNTSSRDDDSQSLDLSAEAKKLREMNEYIISRECDNNNNKSKPTTEAKRKSGEFQIQQSPAEVADEILLQLQNIMKKLTLTATTDPSLLKTCCDIIEIQTRRDDFIARLGNESEFKPVVERPLKWDLKCLQEIVNFPGTRIPPPEEFSETNIAFNLQQIIDTVSRDLRVIKNFVEVYQTNDNLFRNLMEAYKNHLYKLMESLTSTEIEDKQLHSILLFIGDFRLKFPRSEFVDFWHDIDGPFDVSIISPERYQDLTNGYLEKQSAVIHTHMSRGLEVEFRQWLDGAREDHNAKLATTQWPADVTDLCDQHLSVSSKIAPAVYRRMQTILQRELSHAIKLYAAGAKYFIHPCKLSYGSHCPELLSVTKRRKKIQDPAQEADQQTMHAILNSFSLLHNHLSTLSKKIPEDGPEKQFLSLQTLVRAQSLECLNHFKKHVFYQTMKKYQKLLLTQEWFPDATIRDDLCDDVVTFIKALDQQYFNTWFEEVRLRVHHTYLKAMCKTCKHIRCENVEQRREIADRLILEKRKIERTVQEHFPEYQEEYIKLLQQIADVIESNDRESCETSIAILKHTQQDIITKSHLRAILTVHGDFSSRHKKIIGSLYKSNKS